MNFELISNVSTFTCKRKFVNSIACMRTFVKYFIAPLLIILQCTIEPALAKPVEMVAKLDSGFSVSEKLNPEKINSVGIKNVNGVGVVETRPEVSGSLTTSSMAFPPKRKTMMPKDSKQADPSGYQCDGYCGFYISIPMFILPILLAISSKPNVK